MEILKFKIEKMALKRITIKKKLNKNILFFIYF